MTDTDNRAAVGTRVLDFYRELPFNQHSTVATQLASIKKRNPVLNYPALPPLLSHGTRVLEVGSGTGWFANSMSYYHGADVTGIDFNPRAVAFSEEVANQITPKKNAENKSEFFATDLFTYQPDQPFEVVVSLGVLHHTGNCLDAVARVCREFVAPGGYVFIGLYHKYGRRPFLQHFSDMQKAGATEDELFARYRQLHSAISDETHLQSWFRDQVLHPHETQHTLAEMMPILKANNIRLCTSSVNRFEPIDNNIAVDSIIAMEPALEEVAKTRLENNQYFPGFFLFLGQKHSYTQ